MFGHNEVVGQKFFREAPEAGEGKLLVTSIFHTIQGEGPHAGRPAVFVRLAKCQLQCDFCDTYFDGGDWMSPEEVVVAARAACGRFAVPDLLVITGGEPALQIGALMRAGILFEAFERVQFETNGLISMAVFCGMFSGYPADFVVSPKCLGSPARYARLPDRSLDTATCLKFVVSGDPSSPYNSVPNWALEWRARTSREVFVSPMAEYNYVPAQTRSLYELRNAPDLAARAAAEKISFWEPGLLDLVKCRRNYEHAARYALEHDLRLSIQMHLFASLP